MGKQKPLTRALERGEAETFDKNTSSRLRPIVGSVSIHFGIILRSGWHGKVTERWTIKKGVGKQKALTRTTEYKMISKRCQTEPT